MPSEAKCHICQHPKPKWPQKFVWNNQKVEDGWAAAKSNQEMLGSFQPPITSLHTYITRNHELPEIMHRAKLVQERGKRHFNIWIS